MSDRKREKVGPTGICGLCGERIPASLGDYTLRGRPRLYCSQVCQSTGNSRNGAEAN